MNDFERTALIIGLRKLFNEQSFFDICSFNNLLKLARISITDAERRPFDALHCAHYAEMPAGFKQELFMRVIEIFQREPTVELTVEEIFPPTPTLVEQPNVVRRIFGYLNAKAG
jgi:hypothetical protein